MKTIQVVTAAVLFTIAGLIVSVQIAAQDQAANETATVTQQSDTDERFERFETSLMFGLSSDVIKDVESSIYNVIEFKIEHPDFNSKNAELKLKRIAAQDENHSLRYKAYLALAYLNNQSDFDSPEILLALLDYSYQDGIFFFLQETLRSTQITLTND